MQDNSISVTQALNQIQSWLNAKEYNKVTQGCQEILELEPGNQRALALMRQAEEQRHSDRSGQTDQAGQMPNFGPEPTPTPTTPEPKLEPIQELNDPLAHLQVEDKPSNNSSLPGEVSRGSSYSSDPLDSSDNLDFQDFQSHERRTLFLAMLIPAILVVIIGGGIIWYLGSDNREETIDEIVDTVDTETNYIADNESRVETLTKMESALDAYYAKHKSYPSIDDLEDTLKDSDYFDTVPSDPMHGEFDKAGKMFGYTYAVYDTIAGDNTAYIVSAIFEDSRGFGYAWTRGASTKNYDDYRDTSADNVMFIGDTGGGADSDTSGSDTTDSSDDSSAMGPKVNAD